MPCSNCCCSSCFALVGSRSSPEKLSPPPSELMTTNRAALNPEVAHCRDVIRSSEAAITMIQAIVDDLERRKAGLLDLINTHKAAISPLRSFPPEILAEIFGQFVAMAGADTFLRHPPLMLMGICSRWRKIVMDTPRLWTNLKIWTAHPMIDSWIARSKQLPLHLSLDLSSSNSNQVLDALIPHSHRWEDVEFRLGQNSIPILARANTRLHSLKSLRLYFGDTSGTVDFCEVAPRLTYIGLVGFYKSVVVKLPWEQIRVCVLDTSELAHYALQHAENLRGLHLDMSKRSSHPTPRFAMPIGPHSSHLGLKLLFIEWNFVDEDINSFFSSLTLPSLQALNIHFSFLDTDDPEDLADLDDERAELAAILAAFFERSCSHLETLELNKIPFSQGDLIKCLAFAPSLISVDIAFDGRWHAIDGKLLRRLDVSHPRYILPCLRSLALRGSVSMFIEQPLDALVASRRHIDPQHHGVALLENLTLDCSFVQLDELPLFHRFVSEGLDITHGEGFMLTIIRGEDSSSDGMS